MGGVGKDLGVEALTAGVTVEVPAESLELDVALDFVAIDGQFHGRLAVHLHADALGGVHKDPTAHVPHVISWKVQRYKLESSTLLARKFNVIS